MSFSQLLLRPTARRRTLGNSMLSDTVALRVPNVHSFGRVNTAGSMSRVLPCSRPGSITSPVEDSCLVPTQGRPWRPALKQFSPVSYTHLRAHETRHDLVCRLLLEK